MSALVAWAVGEMQKLKPTVALIGGAFDAGLGKPYQDTVTSFVEEPAAPRLHPRPRCQHMGRCSTVPTQQLSLRADIAAAVTNTGATFINTTGWFCYQNLCPMVIGDKIVFLDAGHITQTYAPSPSASCARYSGDPFLRTSGDGPTAVISCT